MESFLDRGACWATVHGVAKSWIWLSNWTHTHTHIHTHKHTHTHTHTHTRLNKIDSFLSVFLSWDLSYLVLVLCNHTILLKSLFHFILPPFIFYSSSYFQRWVEQLKAWENTALEEPHCPLWERQELKGNQPRETPTTRKEEGGQLCSFIMSQAHYIFEISSLHKLPILLHIHISYHTLENQGSPSNAINVKIKLVNQGSFNTQI